MFRKIGETIDKNAHIDSKRSFISGGITGAVVIALGAGMWMLYPKNGPVRTGDNIQAPVIYADATPYKTIPEDPGGMAIPYRESKVFEVLKQDEGQKAKPVEKTTAMLPETEKPMAREEIFAKIEQDVDSEAEAVDGARIVTAPKEEHEVIKPDIPEELLAKIEKGEIEVKAGNVQSAAVEKGSKNTVIENLAAKTEEKSASTEVKKPIRISVDGGDGSKKEIVINDTKKVAAADENQFDSFEPEKDSEIINVAAALTEKNGETEAESADIAAKTEPAAGSIAGEAVNIAKKHFVQLGSVQSEEASAQEWKRLQRSYGDVISNLDYRVQRADLGERGIYYRIQGGPVTEEQARMICDKITSQKSGGCLVIKP